VFLVDNHQVNVQVMREDVKEAIERAGLTGFRFEEVEVI
jgi:energy-coupling factor transporter ATP-binding protein EcfA2